MKSMYRNALLGAVGFVAACASPTLERDVDARNYSGALSIATFYTVGSSVVADFKASPPYSGGSPIKVDLSDLISNSFSTPLHSTNGTRLGILFNTASDPLIEYRCSIKEEDEVAVSWSCYEQRQSDRGGNDNSNGNAGGVAGAGGDNGGNDGGQGGSR